jgi:hypothetical protein
MYVSTFIHVSATKIMFALGERGGGVRDPLERFAIHLLKPARKLVADPSRAA